MFYYVLFENAEGTRIKREVSEATYTDRASIRRFDDAIERANAWGVDAPLADYRVVGAAGGSTTAAGDKSLGR